MSNGLPLARPSMVGVPNSGMANGPSGMLMPRNINSQQSMVGNFSSPNTAQNRMTQPNQQSIMGMIPNSIRPNQQPIFNGPSIYNNHRASAPIVNQQGSLMGNRPILNSNQPSGIFPIRSNIGPNIGQLNQSLLNNPPRLPNQLNNMNSIPHNSVLSHPQSQRPDWDRSSNNSLIGGYNQQPNATMTQGQMLMMNQNMNNPRNNLINGPGNPIQQFPYGLGPPGAGPNIVQGQMHGSNSILPSQPNPFQSQQQHQQNSQQSFSHSNQPNFNGNQMSSQSGILQLPSQQALLNPVGLSQVSQLNPLQQASSQHQMSHSLHHHHPSSAPPQQPPIITQTHMQDPYFHHHHSHRSSSEHQQSTPNSSLLPTSHHHVHHQMAQPNIQGQMKLSDIDFQEAFEKNRIVSSTAISRAVQDASFGKLTFY